MKFSKYSRNSVPTVGLLMLLSSASSLAEFDPVQGGMTEIINCPKASWDVCPLYHDNFYWGGSGPNITYTSPEGWWTYADPGGSLDCTNWINGSIVGGATYEPDQPSIPQNVQVSISTLWWDFAPIVQGICGHQHASTYVWGWRYNGSSWSREFVTAHTRTSYVDEQGVCQFQAEGNPDYGPGYEQFAFGPETLHIQNSPYAVLWTKTQAISHYDAGCGQFECFHRVRVRATYLGGPGVNKGELRFDPPSDEFAIEFTPVVENGLGRIGGTLTFGADTDTKTAPTRKTR